MGVWAAGKSDVSTEKKRYGYVKNYYSAGYEPWQDGLGEASIKSTIILAKCGIADSGLGAPFCSAHLTKARREKRKYAPRAVEAIHLGFESDCNTRASKLYIPSTKQIIVTNQAVYDERFFPYSKEELIKQLH